jgi:hypothetical protein
MSFAKKYLQQYNADSAWNSLGAVGSTSAWEGGIDPFSAFARINVKSTNLSQPRRSIGGTPYSPERPNRYGNFGGNALSSAQWLTKAAPEDLTNLLAGRYFKRINDYSNFF